MTAAQGRGPAAAAMLALSGAAALIYQVVWVKQLALVVGVDVFAVTIAVSGFFVGLALGSALIGRLADRADTPFRLYGALECGVALLGIAVTWVFVALPAPFGTLESYIGPVAWLVPLLLVGVPATLMGGTLPVLMRAVDPRGVGSTGGGLYAANTGGGIVGALLVPFVLIPAFGVRGAVYSAAALNVVAALWAFTIASSATTVRRPAAPLAPERSSLPLVLYAIAGAIALGYEVVWSQAIVQFTSTRTFAFAVVLATYLAGLATGAAAIARRSDRIRDPWGVFALLIASAGLVALVEVALLGRWLVVVQTQVEMAALAVSGSAFVGLLARFVVAALCIVLLPTLLLGAAFPLALRLSVDGARIGSDVGRTVALNTVGGIAGTLLTGLVLIPLIGLVHTLSALAVAAAAVGAVAVWKGDAVSARFRYATFATVVAIVSAAVVAPADRLAQLLPGARTGELVFYEEGRGATVAVVASGTGERRFRRLYIDGVSNSGDAMPSLRYMRLQALLPLVIHNGEPRSALVIGFGTGITAGALLAYPRLERRIVAELLPAVVRASGFFQGNLLGAESNLDVRLRDGRRELLLSHQRYDLVTLEPPPPSASGVVNLYSTEFYRLAASRLEPLGLVAQWLPLPTQNIDETRSLVRSFLDVFPHATLWTTELHETLLVGSAAPITLDWPRIVRRYEAMRNALSEVGVDEPAALLATWLTDRAGLERFAGAAPSVTDDRPRIEYATWVRPDELTRVMPALREVASDAPLQHADEDVAAAIRRERATLWRFYQAGLFVYVGDRAGWGREMRIVMAADGANPYYRWFVGGEG